MQGKVFQGKARHMRERHGKARKDKEFQGKSWHVNARHGKVRKGNAWQGKALQGMSW
jgi:hypothetical protein